MGSQGQCLEGNGEDVGPGVELGQGKKKRGKYIEVQDRVLDVDGSSGKSRAPGVEMGQESG